jgi:succinate-semialdehyde dehydrogenase/glutarate-semialdehyde dehydrogenase
MTALTQPAEAAAVDAVPKGLWIGGRNVPATAGAVLTVDDPSTGAGLAEVADATPDDALSALDAAVAAQAGWAAVAPRERGEILVARSSSCARGPSTWPW